MDRTGEPLLSACTALAENGVTRISGESMRSRLPPGAADLLAARWAGLGIDNYLPNGDTYRTRRFGQLLAGAGPDGTHGFEVLPHRAFRQDVIPMYRGQAREFAPIATEVLLSEPVLALVRADLGVIIAAEGVTRTFVVGLHMVRVSVPVSQARPPAPEGRHRDGHHYVAMHLISRSACAGGDSLIYHPGDKTPFFRTTLSETLDTLIVDDKRVEHEVTAVRAVSSAGTRDMLLIDFDPPAAGREQVKGNPE